MVFWLLDHLEFLPEDTLWVGIRRSLNFDFAFEAQLREEYPSLDLRLVFLDFQTRGAAETLFVMLQVTQLHAISLPLDSMPAVDITYALLDLSDPSNRSSPFLLCWMCIDST